VHAAQPAALAAVRGIGLSGQMHGAVLLDAAGAVLRPCIPWNDVRATAECRELEAAFSDLHAIAGNLAMPGFTAPKLLWVLWVLWATTDRFAPIRRPPCTRSAMPCPG
jgi:xylulokinase